MKEKNKKNSKIKDTETKQVLTPKEVKKLIEEKLERARWYSAVNQKRFTLLDRD